MLGRLLDVGLALTVFQIPVYALESIFNFHWSMVCLKEIECRDDFVSNKFDDDEFINDFHDKIAQRFHCEKIQLLHRIYKIASKSL